MRCPAAPCSFIISLILTTLANLSYAQAPVALGDAVLVNQWTTSNQGEAKIDLAPDGSGAITWWGFTLSSNTSQDGDGLWVSTRRLGATGEPTGAEMLVNDYTTGGQSVSDVSVDEDGDFVVVWLTSGQYDGSDVMARVYASDGTAQTAELLANNITTGSLAKPAVDHDPSGGFVVVWSAYQEAAVQAQRFDATGAKIGTQIEVESTVGYGVGVDISIARSGDFVVVWEADDGHQGGLSARLFASTGTAMGTAFQVASITTGMANTADVEQLPDGGFVVVWSSDGAPGLDPDRSVRGRLFAADGSPRGNDFQVNGFTTGFQWRAHVAAADNGDFVVAWGESRNPARNNQRGDSATIDSIKARLFRSSGEPISDDFEVASAFGSGNNSADVAAGPGGRFAIVWSSYQAPGDGGGSGILMQWYQNQYVFSDDFEAGDTTKWSSSTP